MKNKSGFVSDPRYLDHIIEPNHPESPVRLKAINKRLEASGLLDSLVKLKPTVDPLPYIPMVHSEDHISLVKKQAGNESICRLAVSGALSGVDAVCSGKVKNAFCAVRPPGHHAQNDGEFGFCFYNNIAIAAKYAQKKYNLKRILIIDWDFHHGNATEWAFYDDPSVLFFSTHALAVFPVTGYPDRTGKGEGLGYNINVALLARAGDEEVMAAFQDKLLPAAEKFKPDLVLISAGFDSRKDDTLGYFTITDKGFSKLTAFVMDIAAKYADGRIVSVLEGGYNTEGLASAVEAHLRPLMNIEHRME